MQFFKIYGSAISIASALSLAVSRTVKASETALNLETESINITKTQTSVVKLVHLADRGFFSANGIPGGKALISAYSLNNINAEKIVRAGVEVGRVSPNTIGDREYINAVKSMLNNLKNR